MQIKGECVCSWRQNLLAFKCLFVLQILYKWQFHSNQPLDFEMLLLKERRLCWQSIAKTFLETLTKPCLTLNQQNEMTQLCYNGALINCEMLFMAKWWLPSHHQFDPCPLDLTASWQLAEWNANSPSWLTNTVFSFLALSHCRLIWRGYKQPLDESDLLELNEESSIVWALEAEITC